WALTVVGGVDGDTGHLNGWCLQFNGGTSPTPAVTPTAGSGGAPIVTSFTCNGVGDAGSCEVGAGATVDLTFSFMDADGNATSYEITELPDAGGVRTVAQGEFSPSGARSITALVPVSCSESICQSTFRVVVTDTTGFKSAAASVD